MSEFFNYIANVFAGWGLTPTKVVGWVSGLSAGTIMVYLMVFRVARKLIVEILFALLVVAICMFLWDSGIAAKMVSWLGSVIK
jgi:hypothetical protein